MRAKQIGSHSPVTERAQRIPAALRSSVWRALAGRPGRLQSVTGYRYAALSGPALVMKGNEAEGPHI